MGPRLPSSSGAPWHSLACGDVCSHPGPYRKPYRGVKLSLGSLAWNVGMLEKTTPVSVVLVARLGEARAPLPSLLPTFSFSPVSKASF